MPSVTGTPKCSCWKTSRWAHVTMTTGTWTTSLEPSSHWDIGWKFSSWQPPTMVSRPGELVCTLQAFTRHCSHMHRSSLWKSSCAASSWNINSQTLGFKLVQLCTNSWAICFDNFWVALAPSIQLPMECCFWDMTWTRLDYKQTKPMRNFQGFTNQSLMCMGKGWM